MGFNYHRVNAVINPHDENIADIDRMIEWKAPTEEEYNKIEKEILNKEISNEHFTVYSFCDQSGFDYWVNKQEEPNYIMISFEIRESFSIEQVEELKDSIQKLYFALSQYSI